MKNIGFIGLGKMGKPMARNLLRAGFALTVFDVNTDAVRELGHEGAFAAHSVCEVAERSDVIILSLPDAKVLRAVVMGEEGLTSSDLHGKTVIDTSSVTLSAATECAQAIEKRGGTMLDSPVTGGVWGAERGALQFFVGGDEKAFEAQRDLYSCLGSKATYIGSNGHGQVAKMVCQMLGSVAYAVNAEALAMCENLGVDAAKVAQSFDGGKMIGQMLQMRESGEYGHEGYTGQRGKDLDCAVEAANGCHSFIPVTTAVQQVFQLARLQGLGNTDPTALFLVWEALQQSQSSKS